jgi:basic membrane protein A and related proteins
LAYLIGATLISGHRRIAWIPTARQLTLLGLVALLFSACAPTPQDCGSQQVWCAGLITDFGTVKEGINQQAWFGLQDAKSEGLLDRIDRIETVDARDRAANIATFGDAGYDLVITVGSSISAETAAAAARYPDLRFIGVEQAQSSAIPNVTGLVFHEEQSQTGHVGAVCEAEFIDSIRRYCEGYRAGAMYANPSVGLSISYRQGPTELLFQDREWGKAAALEQLDAGVDVLFAAGGETADAALLAGAERGALLIGAESDQFLRLEAARPQMLTSAINDVRAGLRDLIQLARRGQLPAGEYFGRIDLAPFHDRDGAVAPLTLSKMTEIRAALEAGKIPLDIPYTVP